MPSEILVRVYADGSGDYTSMRAAVIAEAADLPAIDSYIVFEQKGDLRNTDAFVDFNSYTTDATRNITIRPIAGGETTSVAGASGTVYGTNTFILVCRSQFIDFINLEIDGFSDDFHSCDNLTIRDCLIHDGTMQVANDAGCKVFNTIAYDCGADTFDNVDCDQVTVKRSGSACYRNAGGVLTRNVAFTLSGHNLNYFNTTNASNDENASNDSTAPGTTTFSVSTSDFVDYANDDFDIDSSSSLFTAGTGGTRIGALLTPASGGVTVTALLNSNYMVEYSMKKNVASQSIGAQMITISDGSDFTGTVTAEVTIDNGTKTAGAGSVTHEGEGYHSYAPTQAETNGDHIAVSFAGTGALTQTIQVYTTFPQTVDNDTKISLIPTTAMRGTDSANTVVPPSVAQFNARTIVSADYFDPAADTVANVTLVATTTTNTDMRGTDSALLTSGYTAPDNAGITQTQVDIAALNDIAATDIVTAGAITTSSGNASVNIVKINGVTIIGDGSGTPFDV